MNTLSWKSPIDRGLSARWRIAGAFAALALVLFSVVAWISARDARKQLERSSTLLLTQFTDRMAQDLEAALRERLRDIESLVLLETLLREEVDAGVWRALLARMQEDFPYYSWIGVTDTRGVVRAATRGLLEGVDASGRPWFQGTAKGSFVGDVHDARLLADALGPSANGEPLRLLDLSAPLRRDGRFTGAFGAHLDLRWAEEVRSQAQRRASADRQVELLVIDRHGAVLLGPAGPAPPRGAALPAAGLAAWGDGQDYLTATTRLTGPSTNGGLDWRIVARQPVAVALADAQRLQTRLWAVGGFAVLAFGVVGWWLSGQLTAPLRAVARSARHLAARALPVAPADAAHDEVAQLDAALQTLVTALGQREQELQRAAAITEERVADRTRLLQDANADLRSFSRNVAHDVKGPIGSIGMMLRNVLSSEGHALGAKTRHALDLLANECDRLGRLVDELMTMSMLEHRQMQRGDVDLRVLVQAVLRELARESPQWHPEVVCDPLPVVAGDSVLLRQVWRNLLANAFKFSALQAAPQVRLGARREGASWVFSVADNGVGFDMTQAARLFGVFQRLHSGAQFSGTGLGLSIVKRVVERHGGRAWAESAPGQGASFHFTLPVAPAQAVPGPPAAVT